MKSILVPFYEIEPANAALKLAILVAKRFESYVEGLLVLAEPALTFIPGSIVPSDYLTAAVEEWRRFADRARCEFAEIISREQLPLREMEALPQGLAAGWRELQGEEPVILGQHGRIFDLIVVGRPEASTARRWRTVCEAALFETGRPVIVAPLETPFTLAKNIVIAWNGSTESARTVAFALPFLVAAERVEVLTIEGHSVPGPSGDELVSYLAHHGIVAASRTLKTDQRPAGEVILDEAGDIGADFIVKGAFTHSRFRQVVFGGMTQHILDFARIPVFFAH